MVRRQTSEVGLLVTDFVKTISIPPLYVFNAVHFQPSGWRMVLCVILTYKEI